MCNQISINKLIPERTLLNFLEELNFNLYSVICITDTIDGFNLSYIVNLLRGLSYNNFSGCC